MKIKQIISHFTVTPTKRKMTDRSTRSGKRYIAGSSFVPSHDDVQPQSLLNDDSVVIHPSENDYRTIGAGHEKEEHSNAVFERTRAEQTKASTSVPTIGTLTSTSAVTNDAVVATVDVAPLFVTASTSMNSRVVTTVPSVIEPPIVQQNFVSNISTSFAALQPVMSASSLRTGTIPKQMRIVVDRSIPPEVVRPYVETDGRTLESIMRENAEHDATIELASQRSINANSLNNLWNDTMKTEFLSQSKHMLQIRCDLAQKNLNIWSN